MAKNLMPIVPMYHEGQLNAFFFTTTDTQQTAFPPNSNEWEPVYLPNYLMCKNWCDSNCGFGDTSWWSTIHFYIKDYTKVECANGCTINCCDSEESDVPLVELPFTSNRKF